MAVEVAGVRLTHPDRVLYPEQGVTKLDLARYHESIAGWILPHIADRPATLVRCPQGAQSACFYQKHALPGTPEAVRRVRIRDKAGVGTYLVVDSLVALVALVQMGALEIHTWNAFTETIETPDRLVFDIDPDPELPWRRVVEAAHLVRSALAKRGLESFVKTTGGIGLHVVVPIARGPSWDDCLGFARDVAAELAGERPRELTAVMSKRERRGKVFIDYLRNARGATSVAAYSTRARPHAPVSVPLAWDELTVRIRSDHYTIATVPRRLARLQEDPWARYFTLRQGLPYSLDPS